eukprot:9163065-Pyramimonas_sp.AAC.1
MGILFEQSTSSIEGGSSRSVFRRCWGCAAGATGMTEKRGADNVDFEISWIKFAAALRAENAEFSVHRRWAPAR